MAKDEYNSLTVNNEQDGFASFEFSKIQNIETSSFSDNKLEIKDEINENVAFNNENVDEEEKEERTKEKVKEKYLRDSLSGGSETASSASSASATTSAAAASSAAATASSVAATVGAVVVAVPSIITAVAATVLSTKILLDRTRFNATQTEISYEIALEVDAEDDRIFDVRLSNRLLQYNDSKSIIEGDNSGTFTNLTPDTEYEVTVIGYKVVGDTTTVDNPDAFQLIDGDILYETKVSTAPDSPEPPTPTPPAKVVSGIEVTHEPNKTSYLAGDELDLDGLEVSLVYTHSEYYPPEPVPFEDLEIPIPSGNIIGTVTIPIVYSDFETVFDVEYLSHVQYTFDGAVTFSTGDAEITIDSIENADAISELSIVFDKDERTDSRYRLSLSEGTQTFNMYNFDFTKVDRTVCLSYYLDGFDDRFYTEPQSITLTDKKISRFTNYRLIGQYDKSVESETYTGTHLQKVYLIDYIDDLGVFSDMNITISTWPRGESGDNLYTYQYPLTPESNKYAAFDLVDDATIIEGGQLTEDILYSKPFYTWISYHDARTDTTEIVDGGLWEFSSGQVTTYNVELEGTYSSEGGYVYIPSTVTHSGFDTGMVTDVFYRLSQEPASEKYASCAGLLPTSGSSENIVFDAAQIAEAEITLGQCLLTIYTEYYGHEIPLFYNYISLQPEPTVSDFTVHEDADYDNNTIYVTLEYSDGLDRFSDFAIQLSVDDPSDPTGETQISYNFPLRPISYEKQPVNLDEAELEELNLDTDNPTKSYEYAVTYTDAKIGTLTWGTGEIVFNATPMLNSHTIGSLYCYNPQDYVNSNYSLPIDIDMSNASGATSLAIAFDVDDNSQYTPIDATSAYWDGAQSVPTLTTIYDHAVDGWKNVDVSEVFQKVFTDPTGTVVRDYTTVDEGDRVRYTIFAEMDGVYKDLWTDYFTIDFTENTVYGAESSSTYSMTSGGSTNVNLVYSNSYNSISSICYVSLTILESGSTYYIPISDFYPDGTLNISLELANAYEIEPTKMDDPDIGDPIGSETAANIAYDIIHGARCVLNVYYTMSDDTFSHTTNTYVVIFNEAI